MILRLITCMALVAIPVGCDSAGTCGEGTVQVGGTCYPHDPADVLPPIVTVDPPVRTRAVGDVRLTSDEHATIYYTTDGTTPTTDSASEADRVFLPGMPDDAVVSFFAVDVNGNQSAVQTVTWAIDRNGPGAPLPVKLTLSGDQRTVTWNPPVDAQVGGVLLARVDGLLTGSPESGRTYNVGDTLAPGVTVVSVAAGTAAGTFTETKAVTAGIVRYVAWTYDDLHNYGPGTGDYALTAWPAQTAAMSVDLATGAVTVTTQPSALTLSGTATLSGASLSLALEVTNTSTRVVFGPKVLITNDLGNTVAFDNNEGTIGTSLFRTFATGAILPGGKASTTLHFANVANTGTLDLALDIRDGQVIVGGHWEDASRPIGSSVVDELTKVELLRLQRGRRGVGGKAAMHGGAVTVDGRVIMGSRSNGDLSMFDLSTGTLLLSNTLLQGKANIRRLIVDPVGGGGYALLTPGHPYGVIQYNNSIDSELVAFDGVTLRETGRVHIGPSRSRDLAVSKDGRWLAIATGVGPNAVVVVDTATMRVVKTLSSQFAAPSTVGFTGDSLIVAGTDHVQLYRLSDFALTRTIALPPNGRAFHGELGPAGKFWISRDNDHVGVDLTTGAITVIDEQGGILEITNGKLYLGDEGNSQIRRVDPATGNTETVFNFYTSVYGHWVGHSPF